jgi:hypothetical protein
MTVVAATSSGLLTLQTEQDRETVDGGYAGAIAVLMSDWAPASSESGVLLRRNHELKQRMPRIPADEQRRHFGFPPDRYETATGRNHPLQPIDHPKLGDAASRMDDQSDHHRLTPQKLAVIQPRPPQWTLSRVERSDDRKIRQYERPPAGHTLQNPRRS